MKPIFHLPLLGLLLALAGVAQAVEPIPNNSGEYLSPYTSDGVTADWVDKSINAQMGGAVGGAVGAYAGAKAMENVPFIGGFLGNKVGKAAGRKAALAASGGEDYMRETSDLSFNSLEEMSVWMYRQHGQSTNYAEVLKATQEVYPEMKQVYPVAIARAGRSGNPQSVTRVASDQSSSSSPATVRSTPMAPPAPPKPYMERNSHGTLALAKNSGDLSSTGLAMSLGGNTAKANALGLFYDLGLMIASDASEIYMGLGPSWGFNERVRGYAGIQLDFIDYDIGMDDETLSFYGVGYRLGAEFRMPVQNLVLDVGVRSVDAEEDSYADETLTLDYTGAKASLEYQFSDGAGLLLGYEDRDEASSIYLGIRGRF